MNNLKLVRLSLEIDYPENMYDSIGIEDLSVIYHKIIGKGMIEPLLEQGYSRCGDEIFHPAWADSIKGIVYSRSAEYPEADNGRSPVFIFCGPYHHQLFIWMYGNNGHFFGPETECWLKKEEIEILLKALKKIFGEKVKVENHLRKIIYIEIEYEWYDIIFDLS